MRTSLALAALFLAAATLAPAIAPAHASSTASADARVNLATLGNAKSVNQFIVKYRDGSAEDRDAKALVRALDEAAIGTRELIGKRAGGRAVAPSWLLNPVRRMSLGADVVRTTRRLDRADAMLLMRQIAANPDVEYVEVDQIMHPVLTPNDPSYGSQWGLTDADAGIRADRAWDLGTGGGVVVAVLDTGITSHSDLNANVLPGYDFISDPAMANDGNGRDSNASDPGDYDASSNSSWHGTHVAGTIAAVTNNGNGVAGVAFDAKLLPVRVLGVGGGASSDIIDAIVWASGGSVSGVPANANPAEVINMSLGGGGGCGITYQNAINGAVGRGTTVVVAAGNENTDASTSSPANCANVIAVGAVTSTSARSSFSNYGPTVDVSAPGSSILSTINTGSTSPGAEGYAYYSGTSMATPHVAGVVALLQGYRVARGLAPYTPAEVETQLKKTAYPLVQGCAGDDGAGIVDARTALDVADNGTRLLTSGSAATGLSASTGNGQQFALITPANATGLSFSSAGGSGNADLYVRYGAAPTTAVYDCRSNAAGTNESCTIANAKAGTYYLLLQAASSYSSVSLIGATSGNLKPAAAMSVSTSGLTANFSDQSSDSDGSIASRSWKFGDGGSSTLANPSHAYSLAGAYTVQLTPKDNSSATACTLRSVKVNPPPVALSNGVPVTGLAAKTGGELRYTLAVPSGATGLQFDTSGGSGDADLYVKFGSPPTLDDFDCVSGTPTTTETCAIGSAQSGTYYVLVSAYSNISNVSLVGAYGGASSNSPPTAGFSFSSNGLTASFTDASSDSDGSIASRSWDFGDGGSSTATNPSHTYAAGGSYNVKLTVTDNEGASASTTKAVSVSSGGGGSVSLSVTDVASTEGNSRTKTFSFRVKLSAASSAPVTFNIATANGSAIAGSDYIAKSLSGVTIPAGYTSKAFSVAVYGDTEIESDETFYVNVSNVSGATVADGQGLGTIKNDDSLSLSIGDAKVVEGDSGTVAAVFTIKLSQPLSGNVSYNIATANGTAIAGSDYVANSLTGQTIAAGQTSKTFTVLVNGDTAVERNERFKVNLSNVVGVTVSDAQGIGTIANDD